MSKKIKILVSPRNIEEAKVVVNSGVDYVDCKNPEEGSLGANFPWIIKEMKALMNPNNHQKLSATIGDFPYLPGSASLAALGAVLSGADIIKVGLKGPKDIIQGVKLMSNVVKAVKSFDNLKKVVVAGYADKSRLDFSPEIFDIPHIAKKSGADIAMLDTYIKDGLGIFDFLDVNQLIKFKNLSEEMGLKFALAGNLGINDVAKIKDVAPDIIGVRSVVCENSDRLNGTIKADLIQNLVQIIDQA